MSAGHDVIWHDLECWSYDVDLPLWRELAQDAHGPVLDVGAGTGRITLDLARRGYEVVALDAEEPLLAALRERAAGLLVETVHSDARELDIAWRFPLIIVPMQTVQLLEGSAGRSAFLRRAHAHLTPGGIMALAIADPLEGLVDELSEPPRPEMREIDGIVYSSRAIGITDEGDGSSILRIRETVDARGEHTAEENVVRLDAVDPQTLEAEARAVGLQRAVAPDGAADRRVRRLGRGDARCLSRPCASARSTPT